MTVSHTGPDGEREAPWGTGQDNDPAEEPMDLTEEVTQLQLEDDDPPLPWLQGDDDDDDFEGSGFGQTIGFVILGLLAIALVVGGIWYVTKHQKDDVLVADGSTIAAPKTPYKQKPDNRGGKVFEGTGDTSFGISEGQKRPARLGEGDTPQPGFTTVPKAEKSPAASAGRD